MELKEHTDPLYENISLLIESSKKKVAFAVNAEMTMLYWTIGKHINEFILQGERATYGKQIVINLSQKLTEKYGSSFSEKNIRRMMQFATVFYDDTIVASAMRQLTWTHFTLLLPLKQPLQREFYAEMCRIERWNVKTLREKIDGMLYERTAISKKPESLIQSEIVELRNNDTVTPDLVFRDPYFLDFLGLKNRFSEKNLEDRLLQEIESFILELGNGFAFLERQKRIIIDNEDYKIDLLFYHRKLKRLVVIDLKLGKFKASYKGQMELYLRWLEKNEMQEGENEPMGLILCTEGNQEQIELLQLDKAGIKVAEYLTELPKKQLLLEKLNKAIEIANNSQE